VSGEHAEDGAGGGRSQARRKDETSAAHRSRGLKLRRELAYGRKRRIQLDELMERIGRFPETAAAYRRSRHTDALLDPPLLRPRLEGGVPGRSGRAQLLPIHVPQDCKADSTCATAELAA
jgi:hypothetical protein